MANKRVDAFDEIDTLADADEFIVWDASTSKVKNVPSTKLSAYTGGTYTVGPADSGAVYITDGTADDVQIQQAIDAANTAGGGTVFIKAGSYAINAQMTLASNVHVIGEGVGVTILTGASSSGHVFKLLGTGGIDDFSVQNMTLDVNNVTAASGVRVEYATNGIFKNLKITNIPASGWGMVLGVTSGADTVIRNSDIIIDNVKFDNMSGTLEFLLLMNSQRITVKNCDFNDQDTGPGLGIYQVCENINIQNCSFRSITQQGIYYSLSTNRINISNCRFDGANIGGANQSDNGAFGASIVQSVKVENCYFTGAGGALQIGAVDDMTVINCTFEENDTVALIVDDGNSPVSAQSSNYKIIGCTFRNNNNDATSYTINTGILFRSVGGSHYGVVSECQFYDDQGTQTQRYPIGFNGAFTYDHIMFRNNRFAPDTGSGGTTYVLSDSAALGSDVTFKDNDGYTTENSGTATLANGTTSIAVTHGLAVTPAAGDVMITPMESLGSATEFYIDTYTSTQFTINVDADPTQDVDFAWKVIVL